MADRTVHGTGGASDHAWEIVRYDRSGKWVIEHTDCNSRRYVSLDVAVRSCTTPILGLPGGSRFDLKVRSTRPAEQGVPDLLANLQASLDAVIRPGQSAPTERPGNGDA